MFVGPIVINGGWKPKDNGLALYSWAHCSETCVIRALKRFQWDQAPVAYSDGPVNNTLLNPALPTTPFPCSLELLPKYHLNTSLCL